MAKKLQLRYLGDPVLRKPCENVEDILSTDVQELIEDMLLTMKEEQCCGLAAPQVGSSHKLFTLDITYRPEEEYLNDKAYAIINPNIYWYSENELEFGEPCASLPGTQIPVIRPDEIKLKFQDETGKEFDIHARGFLARVLQHEIDHLHGKLAIDYASKLRKKMAEKKVKRFLSYQDFSEAAS